MLGKVFVNGDVINGQFDKTMYFPLGSDLCDFVSNDWEAIEKLFSIRDTSIVEDLRNKNAYIFIAYNLLLNGDDILPYLKERCAQLKDLLEYISGEKRQELNELFVKSEWLPKNLKFEFITDVADVYEVATIETIDDLIFFDIYNTIKMKYLIKKCKNCGRFFVPRGRADIEYCNRTPKGETKSCSQIGAVRKFQEKQENNQVFAEFQKAYKRNHAKIKAGKLTEKEFNEWSKIAREKRELAMNDEISFDEFAKYLTI